jgi:hypothetical protein
MPMALSPMIEAAAAQGEPGVLHPPTAPVASLPSQPTERVHFYNRDEGVVEDGDSIWMRIGPERVKQLELSFLQKS